MLIAGKLAELTAKSEIYLQHYVHCVVLVIYNPPQPACYLKTCEYCPGISNLKDYLNEIFDDTFIDTIQYKLAVGVCRQVNIGDDHQTCR